MPQNPLWRATKRQDDWDAPWDLLRCWSIVITRPVIITRIAFTKCSSIFQLITRSMKRISQILFLCPYGNTPNSAFLVQNRENSTVWICAYSFWSYCGAGCNLHIRVKYGEQSWLLTKSQWPRQNAVPQSIPPPPAEGSIPKIVKIRLLFS